LNGKQSPKIALKPLCFIPLVMVSCFIKQIVKLKNRIKMSEKEKAQELVEKFKDFVHGYVGSSMLTNTEYPEQILSQAKKVATMVVDEILFEIRQGQKLDWIQERNEGQEYIVYWAKVKSEIQDVVS
jgi:hypothetical protein